MAAAAAGSSRFRARRVRALGAVAGRRYVRRRAAGRRQRGGSRIAAACIRVPQYLVLMTPYLATRVHVWVGRDSAKIRRTRRAGRPHVGRNGDDGRILGRSAPARIHVYGKTKDIETGIDGLSRPGPPRGRVDLTCTAVTRSVAHCPCPAPSRPRHTSHSDDLFTTARGRSAVRFIHVARSSAAAA